MADVIVVPSIFYIWHAWCMEGRVGGSAEVQKISLPKSSPVINTVNLNVINLNLTLFFSGILYINPADLGWNPPVSSWIDKRKVQSEKANLTILFDKYIPPCLEALRSR